MLSYKVVEPYNEDSNENCIDIHYAMVRRNLAQTNKSIMKGLPNKHLLPSAAKVQLANLLEITNRLINAYCGNNSQ